ncbi:MAG: Lrp/AsnC ligand binding domain-containing protein [Chloroflexi bacterium]|nr:Lrp/AsnC ligand binding domain-containing protein [Chloroflexota bacterium]
MAIDAYVLIDCSGDPEEILQGVRAVEGVQAAHALFGDLDAIAVVQAESLVVLDRVIAGINEVEGVEYTDTRIARPC